jgi:hypothetical protein
MNSMTLNKQKLAEGWNFFFNNYKKDIIKYCGYNTWGKHLLQLSVLYYDVKNYKKSLYYSISGNFFLFLFRNRFGDEKKYNIKLMKKSIKRYIAANVKATNRS